MKGARRRREKIRWQRWLKCSSRSPITGGQMLFAPLTGGDAVSGFSHPYWPISADSTHSGAVRTLHKGEECEAERWVDGSLDRDDYHETLHSHWMILGCWWQSGCTTALGITEIFLTKWRTATLTLSAPKAKFMKIWITWVQKSIQRHNFLAEQPIKMTHL